MQFLLRGNVKPYVRMTQRGKYIRPQAQEYLASKQSLGWQMRAQMARHGWAMLPKMPLAATIFFIEARGLHRRDLDNEVKAVLDAATGIVYADDRWIDALVTRRVSLQIAESLTVFIVQSLQTEETWTLRLEHMCTGTTGRSVASSPDLLRALAEMVKQHL